MIVYRTVSSLAEDLGFTPRELYAAANTINRHYHTARIPKKDGSFRELHVPDEYLKHIQRQINTVLLSGMPVSSHACAYRYGGSIMKNAAPHAGAETLLKLDIHKFFDHITYPLIKEKVFPAEIYSEANRILLSVLCVYRDTAPQGAPTSDMISNIVLFDFDCVIGKYCREHQIAYTRYCDDMSFSGDFDPVHLIRLVSEELKKEGFFLNKKKTVLCHQGRRMRVTGLSVNDEVRVPADYRRKIRQEMYYIQKYGLVSHLTHAGISDEPEAYLRRLLGRVNYILSVKEEKEFREYQGKLIEMMKEQDTGD